ncbi:hypothetical protein DRP77_04235 [Candidatus Poribacteria bacterium]|nr:MAG: hypothetical protein DRP77_04235 [Candidatus Poribacteria bacterium]
MRCPFCGFQFDENDSPACRSCPFGRSCRLVKCPNCGYETIKPGGLFSKLIGRLTRGGSGEQPGTGASGEDLAGDGGEGPGGG